MKKEDFSRLSSRRGGAFDLLLQLRHQLRREKEWCCARFWEHRGSIKFYAIEPSDVNYSTKSA